MQEAACKRGRKSTVPNPMAIRVVRTRSKALYWSSWLLGVCVYSWVCLLPTVLSLTFLLFSDVSQIGALSSINNPVNLLISLRQLSGRDLNYCNLFKNPVNEKTSAEANAHSIWFYIVDCLHATTLSGYELLESRWWMSHAPATVSPVGFCDSIFLAAIPTRNLAISHQQKNIRLSSLFSVDDDHFACNKIMRADEAGTKSYITDWSHTFFKKRAIFLSKKGIVVHH